MSNKQEIIRFLIAGALAASEAGCIAEQKTPEEQQALGPDVLSVSPAPLETSTSTVTPTSTLTPTPTETRTPTPEPLPTTCLDPEVNQQVVADYLASTPHNTLQEAIDEWKNSVEYVENNYARTSRAGLSTVTRANREEFYRQMWYMSHNMKVVGGYRFSLANHPGFGQGDFGHCLLAASPHMGDILAPIVFGVEQNGVWSQTVFIRQSNNPLVVGKIIDLYGSEDADRWIDQMSREVIHPLIVLRFDRLNWERDPSWHVGYDSVLPLLRNSNGYIMRYTNSPSELGPTLRGIDGKPWGEQASLSRVITEMNLASGGAVGLFAWQISIEE